MDLVERRLMLRRRVEFRQRELQPREDPPLFLEQLVLGWDREFSPASAGEYPQIGWGWAGDWTRIGDRELEIGVGSWEFSSCSWRWSR